MGVCPLLLLLGLALGASAQDNVPITSKNSILLYHRPKILFFPLVCKAVDLEYNILYVVIHVKVIYLRANQDNMFISYISADMKNVQKGSPDNEETYVKARKCITKKHIFFPGPANITPKPTDPPATSPFRITVASTQTPVGPPATVAPTTTEAETTTTATAALIPNPAGDGDLPQADPNATGRVLPIPPTPTDAPQQPPDVETPLPPFMEEEDNTTTAAPGTPTPETYIDEETDVIDEETTSDPDTGFSTEPSPHGECFYVNSLGSALWFCPVPQTFCVTIYVDLPLLIKL